MKSFLQNHRLLCLLLAMLLLGATGFYMTGQHESRLITRVIDGDTLELESGERVRLIGVDTPEKFECAKLERDAHRTGESRAAIQERGEEASQFTRSLCEGKRCWLEYDRDAKDRYGRTLAYVHLENGVIVNEEILRRGYGQVYTRFPFRYAERYRELATVHQSR